MQVRVRYGCAGSRMELRSMGNALYFSNIVRIYTGTWHNGQTSGRLSYEPGNH